MTVIAWDGSQLAADSQISADNLIIDLSSVQTKKLRVFRGLKAPGNMGFPSGTIIKAIAFSGDYDWALKIVDEMVKAGEAHVDFDPIFLNFPSDDTKVSFVIIDDNKKAYSMSSSAFYAFEVQAPFAEGSGHQFALGAMYAAASAEDAVKITKKLDNTVGGKILVYNTDGGK